MPLMLVLSVQIKRYFTADSLFFLVLAYFVTGLGIHRLYENDFG